METRIQLIAIVAAAALLLAVLDMVRRRALLERYALVWLAAAVVLLVLAVWRNLLQRIAEALGIAYAPNALFFLACAAILLLLLNFSIAVSRLTDQSKVLAQYHALLEERVRALEEQGAAAPAAEEQSESDYAPTARA
jgi:hypothetical protein